MKEKILQTLMTHHLIPIEGKHSSDGKVLGYEDVQVEVGIESVKVILDRLICFRFKQVNIPGLIIELESIGVPVSKKTRNLKLIINNHDTPLCIVESYLV